MNNDNSLLISAEPELPEYAPILRVLTAVAYMGIFAGFMGLLASLLPFVSSGRDVKENMIMSLIAVLFFTVSAIVFFIFFKKKKSDFFKNNEDLLKNAVKYSGEVVSCEKQIKKIKYGNRDFEEVTWVFIIKYKDEKNDIVTVKSGKYLNDISNVLGGVSVDVLKKSDGTYAFENFCTLGDNKISLDVSEVEISD